MLLNRPITAFLFCIIFLSSASYSQETLSKYFEPLKPFIGKTWKGIVGKNKEGQPVYDVSKWERILNGNGIKISHSVNDGEYGGETIVVWDKEKESLFFYYFTTAKHYTNGIVKFEDGRMITHEFVTGNQSGVTEVEATSQIKNDGTMRVTSRFKKNSEWTEPKEIIYFEDSEAEVIFK